MTAGRPAAPTAELARAVATARAAYDRCRHEQQVTGRTTTQVEAARAALVAALEEYVARLAEQGLPVPYRLRDELRLQRGLSTKDTGVRVDRWWA